MTTKTTYLSNKDLMAAVKEAKQLGYMTDKLARMLQRLCAKYGKKGNFGGYSFNEDMQAYAMMQLVSTWDRFDPDKSNNPFAFYTQCIKNSFIQQLNKEKKHRLIRDKMLIDQGMNPSFGFDTEDGIPGIEDEQDFESMHRIADSLKSTPNSPIIRDDIGMEIIQTTDQPDELDDVPFDETSDNQSE